MKSFGELKFKKEKDSLKLNMEEKQKIENMTSKLWYN